MLKLSKLPDRTPIKITITVNAALNQALHGYAALYRSTYGEPASVGDLIPFMLDGFLKSDPAFAKALKEGLLDKEVEKQAGRTPRKRSDTPAATYVPPAQQPKEA
jgi:hypothetical protein